MPKSIPGHIGVGPSEVPEISDEEKVVDNVINKIWQEGWRSGHKAGFKVGFRAGRTVMNQWWTVAAVFTFFFVGAATGFLIDWVQECHPITVGETKSCVTRIGG